MTHERPIRYPDGPILPVIHVQSMLQAVDMAGIAKDAGAGGVFLTDRKISTRDNKEFLAEAVTRTMGALPGFWVGVNCQSMDAADSLEFFGDLLEVNGVWADSATRWSRSQPLDDENLDSLSFYCGQIDELRRTIKSTYFGGLANGIKDASTARRFINATKKYVDVVTIEGPDTGRSYPLERIEQIRLAVGVGGKIAVSSEVSVYNIASQTGLVNYFLIDSAIQKGQTPGIIDPAKLDSLIYAHQDGTTAELHAMGSPPPTEL